MGLDQGLQLRVHRGQLLRQQVPVGLDPGRNDRWGLVVTCFLLGDIRHDLTAAYAPGLPYPGLGVGHPAHGGPQRFRHPGQRTRIPRIRLGPRAEGARAVPGVPRMDHRPGPVTAPRRLRVLPQGVHVLRALRLRGYVWACVWRRPLPGPDLTADLQNRSPPAA